MNSTQKINSTQHVLNHCTDYSISNQLFLLFLSSYILLVPLFLYVPFVAHRAWEKSKPMSHTDILTFNNLVFEIINLASLLAYSIGIFCLNITTILVGSGIFNVVSCGQTVLHVLMCGERYLAVVHPITYRKLKLTKMGERIRNSSIIFVWLCTGVAIGLVYMNKHENDVLPSYIILALCLTAVLYYSLTVLYTLLSQNPGDNSQKGRIDPYKKKALKTIVLILCALLLRIVGIPVRGQLFDVPTLKFCVFSSVAFAVNIPSSLVLPLLYLQRMGKLPGAKRRTKE